MSDTQIYQPTPSKEKAFGKYKVTRELGRGAMGVVYECFDPDFERAVAVKILSPDLLKHDTSGEYRQRFRNEMKAAGQLAHPNVISVFDAGEQEGVPYFVMEYVTGMELKEALDQGQRFEQTKVVKTMKEVLSGLKYIHAHNIIHRDLKPANIFLTSDDSAKITDFGIAKLESSELTRVGTIIGSPRYMSPEQCQGLPVDARSDLFTAGIIFYQLLTNEHCFDSNSPTAIMQKIIHSTPDMPSVLIPTLNKAFDDVILKALEKSPDRRYQNADEFIEAIDFAVEGGKKPPPVKPDTSRSPLTLVAVATLAIGIGGAGVYVIPKVMDSLQSGNGQKVDPVTINQTGKTDNTGNAGNNKVDTSAGTTTVEDNKPQQEKDVAVIDTVNPDPDPVEVVEVIEPDPPASNLTPEQQSKIKRLLVVAELHVLQERLVAPSGSNAHYAYQTVLELDPGNQKAKSGLETLQGKLVEKIDRLVKQGEQERARGVAQNGAKAFPRNATLARLSKDL